MKSRLKEISYEYDEYRVGSDCCPSNVKDLLELAVRGKLVIFDTEFTAWEGSRERNWSRAWEHKELIQIGAVKVDLHNSPFILDSLNIILRPKINTKLSSYITNLTGISQERVEQEGVDFKDGVVQLLKFTDHGDLPLMSYGDDFEILHENSKLYSIPLPVFKARAYNIEPFFQKMGIETDQYTSGTLHKSLNIPFSNRVHDAVSDATSVALTIEKLVRQSYPQFEARIRDEAA